MTSSCTSAPGVPLTRITWFSSVTKVGEPYPTIEIDGAGGASSTSSISEPPRLPSSNRVPVSIVPSAKETVTVEPMSS